MTFFTHRDMQRYIEKYAVTSIVTLNWNGKYDRYTNRYRYYRYHTIKKKAFRQESLQFWLRVTGTFTVFYKRY